MQVHVSRRRLVMGVAIGVLAAVSLTPIGAVSRESGQDATVGGQEGAAQGRSDDGIWTVSTQRGSAVLEQGRSIDGPHVVVRLDQAALFGALQRAPMEVPGRALITSMPMTLPMPDGSFARFWIEESPMLAPELAQIVPSFRTYHGRGIDDPTATVRFGWTSAGFHASVLVGAWVGLYRSRLSR